MPGWAEVDWFDPTAFALTHGDGQALGLLRPVVVKSAVDHVVERLVTGLALGLYLPGQKLPPERELAQRLDVSRGTLREALNRLEVQGYLETRRGRYGGRFVTSDWSPRSPALVRAALEPSWARFEALFDLGQQMAPLIARLAAERRTGDDLVRMDEAAARYQHGDDRDDVREADLMFHGAVARATQNPLLVAALGQLRGQLSLGTHAYPYTEAIHRQASREHFELRAAIADRDTDLAAALALAHFVELVEVPLRRLYARSAPKRRAPRTRAVAQ